VVELARQRVGSRSAVGDDPEDGGDRAYETEPVAALHLGAVEHLEVDQDLGGGIPPVRADARAVVGVDD